MTDNGWQAGAKPAADGGYDVLVKYDDADGKRRRKRFHALTRAQALRMIETYLHEQGIDTITDMAAHMERQMVELHHDEDRPTD